VRRVEAGEVIAAGIARQAELLRAGELSSRELVNACLERIETVNPQLRAFRSVYSERAMAAARDAAIAHSG